MCRVCGKRHNSYDRDASSGPTQDASIESGASVPFSFSIPSPRKLSPLRGRTMKEFEENLDQLKKENFALKLRIYFLEDGGGRRKPGKADLDVQKENVELKVENESLREQLFNKQELISQASKLLLSIENQYKEKLEDARQLHEQEQQQCKLLQEKINELEKELESPGRQKDELKSIANLTSLCHLAFNCEDDDASVAALQPDGKTFPVSGHDTQFKEFEKFPATYDTHLTNSPVKGVFSLGATDTESCSMGSPEDKIKLLEEKVKELEVQVEQLEKQLQEKDAVSKVLQEDLSNFQKELEEKEEKIQDLEAEVAEKDQKVDQLMQELETRHLEIAQKETTIQTLHDDLNKVEPEIEVKVHEIVERDRIIEQKIEQIEQQNKILVEIQITLDEKQKQVAELETSVQEYKKTIVELERKLHLACKGMEHFGKMTKTKDKEISHLKKELKKGEKRIRELQAEQKEVQDMYNKAVWKAETNGGEDGLREMVEEENERLWAELEQRKSEIAEKDQHLEEARCKLEEQQGRLRCLEEKLSQSSTVNEQKGELHTSNNESFVKLEANVCLSKEGGSHDDDVLRSELVQTQTLLKETQGQLSELKEKFSDAKMELKILELTVKNKDRQIQEILNSMASRQRESDVIHLQKMVFDSNLLTIKEIEILRMNMMKVGEQSVAERDKILGDGEDCHTIRDRSHEDPGLNDKDVDLAESEKMVDDKATGSGVHTPDKDIDESVDDSKWAVTISEIQAAHDHHRKEPETVMDYQALTQNDSVACSSSALGNAAQSEDYLDASYSEKIHNLCTEIGKLQHEATALKNDRKILFKKVENLQKLHCHGVQSEGYNLHNVESLSNLVQLINSIKNGLKVDWKSSVALWKEISVNRFREIALKYKKEIVCLRKKLSNSHNICESLQTRLEELVEFMEQILEMEEKGIISFSHISPSYRLSLQKTMNESRALSLSLSHSLIGNDDSLSCLESQLCPVNVLSEETESVLEETNSASVSFLNDVPCESIFIDSECKDLFTHMEQKVDSKVSELDAVANKLSQLSRVLSTYEENVKDKAEAIKVLTSELKQVKLELLMLEQHKAKNFSDRTSKDAVIQTSNLLEAVVCGDKMEIRNASQLLESEKKKEEMSEKPLKELHRPEIRRSISSLSDSMLPPYHGGSAADGKLAFRNIGISKMMYGVISDDSLKTPTKFVERCLYPYENHDGRTNPLSWRRATVGECVYGGGGIDCPPSFLLASPSESEAWSEPDRNVSLARIGLDSSVLKSPHDRSLSRSRVNRSSLPSSESESNPEEWGTGVPPNSIKSTKRKSDNSEVRKLTDRLKATEQLNETLKAELNIYHSLSESALRDSTSHSHSHTAVKDAKYAHPASCSKDSETQGDVSALGKQPMSCGLPTPLLQEIRALQQTLCTAIANNNQLRDQLETAIAAHHDHPLEDVVQLTRQLNALQQELKTAKDEYAAVEGQANDFRQKLTEAEKKLKDQEEVLQSYETEQKQLEQQIDEMKQTVEGAQAAVSNMHCGAGFTSEANAEAVNDVELKYLNSKDTVRLKEEIIDKLRDQVKYFSDSQQALQATLAEKECALKELAGHIAQMENASKLTALEKAVTDLQNALQSSEVRLVEMNRENMTLIGEQKCLQAQISAMTTKLELLQKEQSMVTAAASENSDLGAKLRELQAKLLEVQTEKECLLTDRQMIQKEMHLLQDEMLELKSQNKAVAGSSLSEAQKSVMEIELHTLKCAHDQLQSSHTSLQEHWVSLQQENAILLDRVRNLESRIQQLSPCYDKLEQKQNELDCLRRELEQERKLAGCLFSSQKVRTTSASSSNSMHNTAEALSPCSERSVDIFPVRDSVSRSPRFSAPQLNVKGGNSINILVASSQQNCVTSSYPDGKENIDVMSGWTVQNSAKVLGSRRLIIPLSEERTELRDVNMYSGESPDLGIGSDGHFSSLERNSHVLKLRTEDNRMNSIHSSDAQLCQDPSHSSLVVDSKLLLAENGDLRARLQVNTQSLEEALEELSRANQAKASVERAMCRQLTKTRQVLKKAKGNLKKQLEVEK